MTSTQSPENSEQRHRLALKWLLELCRSTLEAEDPLQAPTPPFPDLPSEELFAVARQHGLGNLVLRHLPADDQIRRAGVALSQRSLLLVAAILDLARMLGRHEIPWASFKGPVLSQRLYGSPFFRDSRDIDVVIPLHATAKAYQAFLASGYENQWALHPEIVRKIFVNTLEHIFSNPTLGVTIELHVPIKYPGWMFYSWKDLTAPVLDQVILSGEAIPVLPPESLLVALSMHGTRHAWERLVWLMDIAALLQTSPNLRWPRVRNYARKVHGWHATLLALHLTKKLFHAHLPLELEEEIQRTNLEYLERISCEALMGQPSPRRRLALRYASNLLQMERFPDRIRYFRRKAFDTTAVDIRTFPLPSRFFPLYRFLRPSRLFLRWVLRMDVSPSP